MVEPFIITHHHTFPVLRDFSYETRAGTRSTPTTFFVNAKGNLDCQKVGYSRHLVEKFNWRLEAME